jgi:hypothetical protein
MPRAQPLGERVVALAQGGVRRPRRRGGLHREAALTDRGAGDEGYAEPERFCGKLALENKILKKAWRHGECWRFLRERQDGKLFPRTSKMEEVYPKDYRTFEEAEANIGEFVEEVYNKKRSHSSLGYLPPVESGAQYVLRAGSRLRVPSGKWGSHQVLTGCSVLSGFFPARPVLAGFFFAQSRFPIRGSRI